MTTIGEKGLVQVQRGYDLKTQLVLFSHVPYTKRILFSNCFAATLWHINIIEWEGIRGSQFIATFCHMR